MSQHINPTPKQTDLTALNSKFSPVLMSTDANDAIASGTYYLTGDCANRPADWCIMTVIAFNDETLSQTATSVITGKTYVRSKSVNGWTSWEELALNSKLASQSGTFEYSSGYSADSFKIYKSGNVVTVSFDSLKVNATGQNLVGRIPSGFRPPVSIVGTAYIRNGNAFLFIIGSEGNLRLYDVQNTSQIFYGHVSYCVNS